MTNYLTTVEQIDALWEVYDRTVGEKTRQKIVEMVMDLLATLPKDEAA